MFLIKLRKLKDLIKNIFDKKNKLVYIVESRDWVVKWVGEQIINPLNRANLIKGRVSGTFIGLRDKMIHFGSINTFLSEQGIVKVDKSNKVILTWFHILPDDKRIKYIKVLNEKTNLVHTACQITKNELIKNGLAEEKIIVIPLSVDLSVLKAFDKTKKDKIKRSLNLPKDKIIIGSFQKDGVGWGEGLEPKMEKGPDVFCDAVEKIAKEHPIHILLTGPARGYVKSRLKKAGIPYTHKYFKNYFDIVNYYNCLDLYLIASRTEGGPKSILESWACGVPFVSTRMGMAPDIVEDNENGVLVDVGDVDNLVVASKKILNDSNFRNRLINNGLKEVEDYNGDKIAKGYYNKIYSKLIYKDT